MNNVPLPITLADREKKNKKLNHKLIAFQLCALRLIRKFKTYPYTIFAFLPVKSSIINEINNNSSKGGLMIPHPQENK